MSNLATDTLANLRAVPIPAKAQHQFDQMWAFLRNEVLEVDHITEHDLEVMVAWTTVVGQMAEAIGSMEGAVSNAYAMLGSTPAPQPDEES